MNALGESSWSSYSSMTTLIDTSRIPRVSSLSYHNKTHSISFQAAAYPLYLVAKLEVLFNSSSSSWQLIKTVPVKTAPYEIRLPKNLEFHNLRLVFQLKILLRILTVLHTVFDLSDYFPGLLLM